MNKTQQIYDITEKQLINFCSKYTSVAQIIQKGIGLKKQESKHTKAIKEKMEKWKISFSTVTRYDKIDNISKIEMEGFINKYKSITECLNKEYGYNADMKIVTRIRDRKNKLCISKEFYHDAIKIENMERKNYIKSMTEDELLQLADIYTSVTDIVKNKIGISEEGRHINECKKIIKDKMYKWQIEFLNPLQPNQIYPKIEKECPVCSKEFSTVDGGAEEKFTCSYACSNTYFRSGKDNGQYTGKAYRTICFEHNKKECIICGEDKIVAVHHYDENHNNNEPSNLIPLCPTHHQYLHSRYKYLIQDKVDKYQKELESRVILQGVELAFQASA